MAEQGLVLDIDAKFIERLKKADEALDKFVESTDKLSRQFDELASGSLSRFASAIDSIVQSISQVGRVNVGDMGFEEASTKAAEAADSVNSIAEAFRKLQVGDTIYSNNALAKNTQELESSITELSALQTQIHETLDSDVKYTDTSDLIERSNFLMGYIEELEKERDAIIDVSEARIKDSKEQEQIDKRWREMEEQRNEAIRERARIESELAKRSSQNYASGFRDERLVEQLQYADQQAAYERIFGRVARADQKLMEMYAKQNKAARDSAETAKRAYSDQERAYEQMFDDIDKHRRENERKEEASIARENEANKKRAQSVIDGYNKDMDAARKSIESRQRMYEDLWNKMERDERTTFSGAMDFSKSTKSINDQIQAIKYLEEARNKLDKTTLGEKEYKRQVKEINDELKRQNKELDELTDKHGQLNDVAGKLKGMLGTMFSISAIRGYVNQIIQVRGEFELQQRALQALLQNKAEANKLWEQTVQLAVKSPFQVKELVTYTKQLAAYRVETEKLHDTTKMLADISAGLGVDMGRLILAFGQVKAANYLRGTELRQFSEAGINILDELARYYSALEGKIVTVGEVFDRVSKRMVSFTDVETVLKNVTSAGGMFYQMQEIQAETLKGSVSNLKDQLDLMLNDIGKSNEGILKGAVQLAALLIKNYNKLVPVLTTVGLAFAGMYLNTQRVASGIKAISRGGLKLINGLVNPWTLALAAISAVVSAYVRYRQETNQITKEHNRLRDSLHEIEIAFRDAMNKDVVDGMRNSLSQLVELAKNEFQIDLKLNDEELKSMDFSALEAKFVELRGILFDANAIAENVKKGLAAARNWDSTFMRIVKTLFNSIRLGFGFDASMFANIRQFEKSAQDVLVGIQAESKRIANELQLNTAHMLRLPQAPLETNLQYVSRLVKAYEGLRDEMEMKGIDTSEIGGYINQLRKHTAEASRELGLFFAKYEAQIVHLSEEQKKAFINNIVDSQGWSEYTKELIYNLYNLDLERTIQKATAQFDIDKLDEADTTSKSKDTNWENLLRTIKEANSAYKELTKTFDAATAKEGVLAKYADALNDALSKVVINGKKLNAAQFLEIFDLSTEEGMLKALDMIAKEAPEAADKLKAKLEKGEIIWEAKINIKKAEDEELANYLENLFSGYELSIELDKMNIPQSFAKDFFGLEALSLDELRDGLTSMGHKFVGTELEDEYAEALKRIDKMEREAQQERLKTYLEYARDAVGERAKIKLEELRKLQEIELAFAEKEGDSEEVKATKASAKDRAAAKVKADSLAERNKLEWEEFRKSDTFTRIFEDLDMASDALIEHALTRLDEFKNEWKDMPLEDMREVVDKMNQLRERIAERDPFGKETRELRKRVKEDGRTREAIEMENVDLSAQQAALEQYESELQTILSLKEQERLEEELMAVLGLKNTDIASMEEQELRDALTLKQSEIRAIKDKIKANEASLDDQKLLKLTYELQAAELESVRQMANDLYGAFRDISDLFMDSDSPAAAFAEMGMSAADAVLNCFALQLQLKAAEEEATKFGAAMNTAMKVVGWIVMAVQVVAAVLSAIFAAKDKRLERQIESLTDSVEILDKELSKIEEKLDEVFSATHLAGYVTAAQRNIDAQIDAYNRMIELEKNKKKVDEDRIKEWGDAIADLNEQRDKIYKEGFSTASASILDDALSSAEAFVDAWYEAFQETGDGLSGLQGEFQNMLSNLIKRQAALQIVGSYTNMYRDMLKKYLDPDNGDVVLTAHEATQWAEQIKATFPELNEALSSFYTSMEGILSTQGELSDLGKGVQGITETTAQAVEALLNSIRFYVADSNAAVRRIDAYVSGGDKIDNPLLSELQAQTALIRSIESMFGSVIGHGSSAHSGAYLKVLM